MAKFLVFTVLVVSIILDVCDAGAIAFPHRDTGLDELKSIDSYVSSALPVLRDGFFIGTSRGPILVKSAPSPGDRNSRPAVRSKYYNTLPRLIPAGFEGIAISHFNLGAASPNQPFPLAKPLENVPAAQSQQYAQIAQPSEHYVAQPQQVYLSHQQAPQYVEQQQQQQQQYFQQQYAQQQEQQYVPQPEQQPQQYVAQPQQYIPQEHHQQQHQILQSEQSQQELVRFGQPQQYQQIISDQADGRQIPQESAQISERIQSPNSASQQSFQDDNLLRPEQEQSVTAYQTQIFGAERFQSQKLIPNSAVIETTEYEQTLPDTLRNQFYKNANLATLLAQESLPVQGEQIIDEWDTNKIAKGKIHALLRGAGLI
ncbi:hypothetical protein Ocin01_09020 [Orchesella cincta]|uniref:Uncharacterized protein n=1 Tax=Orchesella cincta TaxID=48709 RepID=A0A1D2MXH2_ORCCI|nr:hypothetical protein Ocin01_09020 [Orchesella cincta]